MGYLYGDYIYFYKLRLRIVTVAYKKPSRMYYFDKQYIQEGINHGLKLFANFVKPSHP